MAVVYPQFNGNPTAIPGFPGAVLVGVRNKFTPGVGVQFEQTYRGPFQIISNLGDLQRTVGWTVEFTNRQGPMVDLVATITTTPGGNPNNDFVDVWEIVRNSVQKEILDSDHPYISFLNDLNLQELKIAMQETADTFYAGAGFTIGGDLPSYTAANYLLDLWYAGAKNVEVKQPILRLTRTMSPLYTSAWSLNNVDKVLTTSSMIADSGVPNDYIVDLTILTNNLTSRVETNPDGSQVRADSLVLKFGWLKDVSGLNRYGSQRQQIIQEWKFGLWDTIEYNDPI